MASGYNSTIYFPNKDGTANQYKVSVKVTESTDALNIRSYVTISATISPNGSTWAGAEKTMEILWNDGIVGSTGLTSLLSGQSHTASGSFYVYHNGISGAASGTVKVKIHSGSSHYASPGNTTVSAGTATLPTLTIPGLPTSSLSYSDIKPTQATIKSTTAGTVSYVKKNASTILSQLMTSYPDLPLMVMSDGSVWLRVFNHDNRAGAVLFTSSEALNTQQTYKYSRLNILDNNLKNSSGKFEFLLRYPTLSKTEYNRWRQTNAPQNEYVTQGSNSKVAGYEAVSISWTGEGWGGLERSQGGYALADGYTGHDNWWYALASYQVFQNGVPGPDTKVNYRQQELWVRVPNITGTTVAATANTNLTISNLEPETDYLLCSDVSSNVGYGFSTVITITTPTDQARAYIKKDGAWVKGKLFIKENGQWIKSKKVYIKNTSSWKQGINN